MGSVAERQELFANAAMPARLAATALLNDHASSQAETRPAIETVEFRLAVAFADLRPSPARSPVIPHRQARLATNGFEALVAA